MHCAVGACAVLFPHKSVVNGDGGFAFVLTALLLNDLSQTQPIPPHVAAPLSLPVWSPLHSDSDRPLFSQPREDFVGATFDYNDYFTKEEAQRKFPGGLSFSQWQKEGVVGKPQDTHSKLADPMFTQSRRFPYDTVAVSSPALELGFTQIEVDSVGPTWTPPLGEVAGH